LNDVLGKSRTGDAQRDVLRNAAKTGECVFPEAKPTRKNPRSCAILRSRSNAV
jgi:hypothetical protein